MMTNIRHVISCDVSNSGLGPDPKIGNQGEYKTVQRIFNGAISEMAKKKNSEKVVARQNAGRQKDSNTPDEDEAHKSSSDDEDFDTSESLGKLVKADLLAAALKNATELAELRKQAKTRATSERKSNIADDDDDGDADGISDGEQETSAKKTKRTSPRKQPALSKLGERAKKQAAKTSSTEVIDLDYELWKATHKPLVVAVAAPVEGIDSIAK